MVSGRIVRQCKRSVALLLFALSRWKRLTTFLAPKLIAINAHQVGCGVLETAVRTGPDRRSNVVAGFTHDSNTRPCMILTPFSDIPDRDVAFLSQYRDNVD